MITPWIIFVLWMFFTKTGQKFGGLVLFLAVFSLVLLTPVAAVLWLIHSL